MRLGVKASLLDFEGDNNNFTALGVGIGYFSSEWSFAIDASKRDFEDSHNSDETVKITPGLQMNIDQVSFPVDMDIYTNEPEGANTDEEVWFGVGFGHGDPFNLAIYHDYKGEWAFVLSLFM